MWLIWLPTPLQEEIFRSLSMTFLSTKLSSTANTWSSCISKHNPSEISIFSDLHRRWTPLLTLAIVIWRWVQITNAKHPLIFRVFGLNCGNLQGNELGFPAILMGVSVNTHTHREKEAVDRGPYLLCNVLWLAKGPKAKIQKSDFVRCKIMQFAIAKMKYSQHYLLWMLTLRS